MTATTVPKTSVSKTSVPKTSVPETALRGRVARACVTIAVIGLVLTVGAFALARDVVTRLDRQRVDRPANAALLAVQQLSSSADQVLATAAGVVAATGGDPTGS